MSATNWQKLRPLGVVLFAVLLAALVGGLTLSCSGGGGEAFVPPPETEEEAPQGGTNRPIIVALSPHVASVGQTITITGYYFGYEQAADALVTIGGRKFDITSWSAQTIEAIIPANAVSGIVVVTVGNLSSQSGINAQLFIGEAPPGGNPLIVALSQDTAIVNTRVTIYGFHFGNEQGDSAVTFTGPQGERVPAAVVTDLVNGVERPSWTDTSIQVFVPAGSYRGPIIITVGGVNSNDNFQFTTLVPPVAGAPIIESVTPERGPEGTTVVVVGRNFGFSRGVSVVSIAGLNLQIITWTDRQIVGVIPQGAITNVIRVLVGGIAAESPHVYIVETIPALSAVVPNMLQVGQRMEILGNKFGMDPGRIMLTPDSSAQGQSQTTISGSAITSWSDTRIVVDSLPSLNSDAGVPLVVTLLSGGSPPQASANSITVNVYSPVQATLEVDLPAGVKGDTTFGFEAAVGGGQAPYKIDFYFGDGGITPWPNVTSTVGTEHIYNVAGVFTPFIRATDASGSRATATGDEVTIVEIGDPAIYDVRISELGLIDDKPNSQVGVNFGLHYSTVYNFDDSFIPLLSAVGLGYLNYAERQPGLFIDEGRPYAYRDGEGSRLQIFGYNLLQDDPTGSHVLKLNIGSETVYPITSPMHPQLFTWDDNAIEIRIPTGSAATQPIGGPLGITFANGKEIVSSIPLVAQPWLGDNYTPKPPHFDPGVSASTEINIPFYDGIPPAAGNYIGTKSYMFWSFPANLQGTANRWDFDRNGDGTSGDNYLYPVGIPITILPGQNRISFDLGTFAGMAYAARDPAGDSTTPVWVEPTGGDWQVYIWVGVKETVFPESFANSGIISNALRIINVQP